MKIIILAASLFITSLRTVAITEALFGNLKREVWSTDYNIKHTTTTTNNIWPIINYHDPIGTRLATHSKKIVRSLKCAKKHRVIIAYKKTATSVIYLRAIE